MDSLTSLSVPRPVAASRLAAALAARDYRFVAITPASHRLVNGRAGADWARDLRDVFGWSRPFRAGVVPADVFELAQAAGVLAPAGDGWRSLVRFATLDETIFIHSAFPTDGADAVFFGPDTYRFVRAVRAYRAARVRPVRRAVDIGCGSGAAGIVVAGAFPHSEVVLADINHGALEAAQINAASAGLQNTRVCHSDVFAALDGAFDLIVANPPYLVDPGARVYRHGGGALGAGLSGRIVAESLERLAPGGGLVLYTGSAIVAGRDVFRAEMERLLNGRGVTWRYHEVDPDVFGEELAQGPYVGVERIAAVVLIVERPA